jgi:hypothetical protein
MKTPSIRPGSIGPMTVITMSRTEIDRMSVLQDLTDRRISLFRKIVARHLSWGVGITNPPFMAGRPPTPAMP